MTDDAFQRIEPRTLKGFRDYLPAQMIPRERIIDTARRVYRSYGFAPIDTPALEHLDVLTGKGGGETEKQLYKFQDAGGRWVGMRFDLTVPLARFVAQHLSELGTPFKRYHIGTVWRGENVQRGRYREFMQADFDTIGTLAIAADVETALVIHDLFLALGFSDFTIRVNNRQVLNGLLKTIGLAEKSLAVLRAVDKLAKDGPAKVQEELVSGAGATADQASRILQMVSISGDNEQVLRQLDGLVEASETGQQGVSRLRDLLSAAATAGVPKERIRLDVSIARGLDYYTGTIYETFLTALPGIGSVCSGGRYDNLAGLFTSQQLPGVGASLGLDRLLTAMEELSMLPKSATPADVFIPFFDAARLDDYLRLAAALRRAGLGVELYPEPKKLGQQLGYADRRGFRFALIVGGDEFASGTCQLKDLADRSSGTVSLAEGVSALVEEIRRRLAVAQP
jgi:histidyl-tRNA synthetase